VAETALVVLVPELAAVIGAWYGEHTEAGRRGLPPHVTLLYPFLDWSEYDEEAARRIVAALGRFKPFELSLAESDRFRNEVATLYLRPEPGEPVAAMIEALAAAFPDQPLYGAGVEEIVPHVTVAQGPEPLLDTIERELATELPVKVRVERVWLVADTASGWQRRAAFPLL
jgi:2'-5' RNA ligase